LPGKDRAFFKTIQGGHEGRKVEATMERDYELSSKLKKQDEDNSSAEVNGWVGSEPI
jgi:hypothetical protein